MSRRERRTFTTDFKKQRVQLYQNGKSRSEIIKEYDLTPSSLDRWIMQDQIGELPLDEKQYELGIHWAGFCFSTHLNLVMEESKWLWSTYNHPKSVNEPLYLWTEETSYLEVPYGDYQKLQKVREYIMKQRGLVPAVKG